MDSNLTDEMNMCNLVKECYCSHISKLDKKFCQAYL